MMAVLLWVVAALIVGSVIYLSALERTRDFAVLKAVGVSTRSVLAGLCLQAVIVAVVAAVLGGLVSLVLGPLFPMRVVVPTSAFLLLPVVGVRDRSARERRRNAASGHDRSRARIRGAVSHGGSAHQRSGRRVLQRRVRGAPDRRPQSRGERRARWRCCSARAAAARPRCCRASAESCARPRAASPSTTSTSPRWTPAS